jgi:prephenate dehydrogenase
VKKPPLLLVGYGRFGSFIAPVLRRHFSVHVLERRATVRLARGLKKASAAEICRFGLVVLAIPSGGLDRFLEGNHARFREGTFIAQLSAVQELPLAEMERLLPAGVSYAGLHPIFGPASARAGLRGQTIAFCGGRLTPVCRRRLTLFLRRLGLKIIETTPANHDRAMASTLFLTQFIGSIVPYRPGRHESPLDTPAFRHLAGVLETAAGNSPDLLRELCMYNRFCENTLQRTINGFAREIRRIRSFPPPH